MLIEYVLAFLLIFSVVLLLLIYLERYHVLAERSPALTTFPRISVIIPAHNEEDSIASTIRSLARSQYPKGKLHISVVDDGSTDGTLAIARKVAKELKGLDVLVLTKPSGGKSSALNLGLRHAKGELVATLDADCDVEPDSILKLAAYFSDPTVTAATSAVKVRSRGTFLQRMQYIEYLFTFFTRKLLSSLDSVFVTPGPLSMFRRNVFARIGGFDEHSIMEDQEMALRLQSRHLRIVSALDAVVYTHAPASLRELIRQRVRWNRGGIRNFLKYAFLVSPRYGDFGVLILPLSIVSVLAVFAVFLITAGTILSGQILDLYRFGLVSVVYGADAITVLSFVALFLSLLWLAFTIAHFRSEKISWFDLLVYFAVYPLLSGVFWLATVAKEASGARLKW